MTKHKMIILYCLISLLLVSTTVYSATTLTSTEDTIEIHLLGLNDFHGQLNTHHNILGQKVGGAEYVSAYINKFRKQYKNTFLVHSGDMVGGSPPLSALFHDEPTIEFLNYLNVDIGTLGNHEFDEGVQEMLRLVEGNKDGFFIGSTATYISANVIENKSNSPLLPPYTIKEMNGVKLGFIGALTTETNKFVITENRQEITISDEVAAINLATEKLIDQGVRSIIVLAHISAKSNLKGGNPQLDMIKMAPLLHDEVDVIFAGHSHGYANTVVDNKLIVQGYAYGKAISDVKIIINPQNGQIINKKADIHLTFHSLINPDQTVVNLLTQYEEKLSRQTNEIISSLPHDLSRKKNTKGQSELGSMIVSAIRDKTNSDIAFLHHGGIRFSLNKGKVTLEDIYRSLPFNHKLVKMQVTGQQLINILNQQWTHEKENLLQSSGISYQMTHTENKLNKIIELKDSIGKEIEPDKIYTVVTSDYLAYGGDGFTAFKAGEIIFTGETIRDVFIHYLKKS
ncbi:bifunctional metallophosphatase/5'-nucleotidase [Metabacillus litoralis]|uniref:bifunctional metallophosphatase/5'-nucleotidase n=1 Tax=Metabacillus TaxID=2675233 RepID=UPI000EF62350|nr:bifunctional UDP-sugar hydrolase/5'-nucleotidase [Metabacillus litoralis]MCM3163887.1 bifunctional metallophosphatase/5'-nucleotidase [Metabacillus litoralis]MCM3410600.1 bifunctional metallophosphatase/5'-nucleotidase [Metabacillus litoralis]UHA58313.1 bifunctional metallophosphatase/5'-nucleotidase [Metabacillus litoralis]